MWDNGKYEIMSFLINFNSLSACMQNIFNYFISQALVYVKQLSTVEACQRKTFISFSLVKLPSQYLMDNFRSNLVVYTAYSVIIYASLIISSGAQRGKFVPHRDCVYAFSSSKTMILKIFHFS